MVKLSEDDEMCFAVFAEWFYIGEECDTSDISKGVTTDEDLFNYPSTLRLAGPTMTILEGTGW